MIWPLAAGPTDDGSISAPSWMAFFSPHPPTNCSGKSQGFFFHRLYSGSSFTISVAVR